MASDQLTVQISANSSKLRADLSLAQAELRKLQKELRAASDAGDKERVSQLSAQYEGLAAQIRKTSRALNEHNRTLAEQNNVLGAASESWLALGKSIRTSVAAFTAIEAARKGVGQFNDALERMRKIGDTVSATGFPLDTIKAFQKAAVEAGDDAENVAPGLLKMTEAAAAARAPLKDGGRIASEFAAGVKVMRGGVQDAASAFGDMGVKISRGGVVEKTAQLRDIFARFPDTLEGNKAALRAVAQAYVRLKATNPAEATKQLSDIYGSKNVVKYAGTLENIAANWERLHKQVAPLPPTQTDLDAIDEYDKKVAKVNASWNAVRNTIALVGVQFDFAFFKGIDRVREGWAEFWPWFSNGWTSTIDAIKTKLAELGQWDGSNVAKWLDTIIAKAKEAWSALGKQFGNPENAPPPGGVMAAGGMVRGPGSGTSDSILARLSNGEFVMRAAAVRAWGPQLLSAMNALNRPLRGIGDGSGFANGGMVSARTSDGATVNLHFPGGSFALRGDRGIVMGLTREARRAALLSGGRAPGAAVV